MSIACRQSLIGWLAKTRSRAPVIGGLVRGLKFVILALRLFVVKVPAAARNPGWSVFTSWNCWPNCRVFLTEPISNFTVIRLFQSSEFRLFSKYWKLNVRLPLAKGFWL